MRHKCGTGKHFDPVEVFDDHSDEKVESKERADEHPGDREEAGTVGVVAHLSIVGRVSRVSASSRAGSAGRVGRVRRASVLSRVSRKQSG